MPVGYYECERRIAVLRKFQDLVRHRERWAAEIEFARPLKVLLPEGTTERNESAVIDQQIARLQTIVRVYLHQAGIETEISWTEPTYDQEMKIWRKESVGRYDIVGHYFTQPDEPFRHVRQHWFEQLMRA
jgi:hypothetical protein